MRVYIDLLLSVLVWFSLFHLTAPFSYLHSLPRGLLVHSRLSDAPRHPPPSPPLPSNVHTNTETQTQTQNSRQTLSTEMGKNAHDRNWNNVAKLHDMIEKRKSYIDGDGDNCLLYTSPSPRDS